MKRQLLVLVESPLDERDYERFGIAYLAEKYDVLVLDCTSYVYPQITLRTKSIARDTYQLDQVSFLDDVKRFALAYTCNVVFDMLGESHSANAVRRALIKNGAIRVMFWLGGLYLTPAPLSLRIKGVVRKLIRTGVYQRVLARIVTRIATIVVPVPPVDLMVLCGTAGADQASGEAVYGHSFDYERWRQLGSSSSQLNGRYALFLDEDMVHHSDYARFGVRPPVTEDAYYPAINRLFDQFERATGIPVHVAAHPRSRYSERSHLWGARQLIYGGTPEAVANASLVFAHFSTAISFAVLARKPIVHLVSQEILESFMGPQILGVSGFLGTRLLNMDQVDAGLGGLCECQVNESKYAAYQDRYLKAARSEDAPLWEIVVAAIEKKLDVLC